MDFWEVLETRPPTRLLLRALTRMPGTATLEIVVAADPAGGGTGTLLRLRTSFEPSGAAGHAYWWLNLPLHTVTFALMTHRLARTVAHRGRRGPPDLRSPGRELN